MEPALRARLFVGGTIAAGVLVCLNAAWTLAQAPLEPDWLVLLGLTVLAGLATLRVPAMPISFSISDTFTIAAAVIAGPAAGALTAAADGLVLSFRMANDRRTARRILFNMACLAIATWAAAVTFHALTGGVRVAGGAMDVIGTLLHLVLFGAVHFGLNSGMIATAVALERRMGIAAVWREHFSGLWISPLGGVFAALLMIVLWEHSPVEILVLLAPLPVILYVTLRHTLGRAEDQIAHLENMNRVYLRTIEALAHAVDAKDHVTHDHVRRVQERALQLAHALGVHGAADRQAITAASLLHDIGKIAIPERILNKPGRLTAAEFDVMKTHAAIGADILAVIGFPYPLVPIVRHHHENWDGTGYPDGLAGEQIPIGSRILQVVDCYDALTSDRPYRTRMSDGEALKIVWQRRATMYDPRVVDALLGLHGPAGRAALAAALDAEALPPAAARPRGLPEARPLDLLDATCRALRTARDAHDAGRALWRELPRHLPADALVWFAHDLATDRLVPLFMAGEPILAAATRLPIGDRLSGWVAATGQAVRNSDAQLDADAGLDPPTCLRCVLAVPIAGRGTTGVLSVYAREAGAYTADDQRLLESLAAVVAAGMPELAHGAAGSGPRAATEVPVVTVRRAV